MFTEYLTVKHTTDTVTEFLKWLTKLFIWNYRRHWSRSKEKKHDTPAPTLVCCHKTEMETDVSSLAISTHTHKIPVSFISYFHHILLIKEQVGNSCHRCKRVNSKQCWVHGWIIPENKYPVICKGHMSGWDKSPQITATSLTHHSYHIILLLLYILFVAEVVEWLCDLTVSEIACRCVRWIDWYGWIMQDLNIDCMCNFCFLFRSMSECNVLLYSA